MTNFMTFASVFDNDEAKYEGFKNLCFDTANGIQVGYTTQEANKDIKAKFMSIIGCNEQSSKKEIRRAIKAHQAELFAISEEIIPNLLVSGWQGNEFFNEYVEMRNLDLGDTNDFYIEDNSIMTVGKVSGNHWDLKRQRLSAGTHQSIATSWYGMAVYAEYERLLTGVEEWSTFVNKVTEAFNRYINEMLYRALLDAAAGLGAQWQKTSALNSTTKATLRQLCMDVAMATGSEVVIMGTRTALQSVFDLTNVDWASNDMKNQMHTTGRFGFWEGIRLK